MRRNTDYKEAQRSFSWRDENVLRHTVVVLPDCMPPLLWTELLPQKVRARKEAPVPQRKYLSGFLESCPWEVCAWGCVPFVPVIPVQDRHWCPVSSICKQLCSPRRVTSSSSCFLTCKMPLLDCKCQTSSSSRLLRWSPRLFLGLERAALVIQLQSA